VTDIVRVTLKLGEKAKHGWWRVGKKRDAIRSPPPPATDGAMPSSSTAQGGRAECDSVRCGGSVHGHGEKEHNGFERGDIEHGRWRKGKSTPGERGSGDERKKLEIKNEPFFI
jgi:hypothetical protein